ncbi:poly polymerase and DNA-ligase Zn-finger region-domain-containing protein, partial [Delphinella strobiligena]
VETSPNNRAGCGASDCKDNKVKILKGELRHGVYVTIKEHSTWKWRHWGCVTPKQIANMKEESGGDTDLIDGFDEVSEEFQDKVVRAIEQGTVDMAD